MTRQLSDQLCACGCGERTFLALKTNRAFGHVKGEPLQWRRGHQARTSDPFDVVEGPLSSACWVWRGCVNSSGYGVVSVAGRRLLAHRWMFEVRAGPIPLGKELHHACETKRCVNPAHLELVTRLQHRRLRRCDASSQEVAHA